MPLDPSIPLQVKTLQLPDPLEGAARVANLQAALDAATVRQFQLSDYRREAGERERLQRAIARAMADTQAAAPAAPGSAPQRRSHPGLSMERMRDEAMREGLVTQALGFENQRLAQAKSAADIAHTNADTVLKELDAGKKQAEQMMQMLSAATPENWNEMRTIAASRWGADALQNVPAQYDPQWVEKGWRTVTPLAAQMDFLLRAKNEWVNPDGTVNQAKLKAYAAEARAKAAADWGGPAGAQAQTARDRLALDQSQRGQHYDAERGVIVNTVTGTASPVTQGGQPLPAKLPESSKKEIASLNAQLSTVDAAMKAVRETPGAFGFMRGAATMSGAIPETLAGRLDTKEERETRSFIFNVTSRVINERAGAAQSAQELARLRSFLPSEADSAQQIHDKLEAFRTYLIEQRKGYEQPAAPTTATRPAGMTDKQLIDEADAAIAKGADPVKVRDRLAQYGIKLN